MKKACMIALVLMMAVPVVRAGGPPNTAVAPPKSYNASMVWQQVFQRRAGVESVPRSTVIDVAMKYLNLSQDEMAAVNKLDDQRAEEIKDGLQKLLDDAETKYEALVEDALSPDTKALYEQVVAIEKERNAAVEAARAELDDTIEKVSGKKMMQGRFSSPYTMRDRQTLLHEYVQLTPEQMTQMQEIRKQRDEEWRRLRADIQRPADRRDIEAQRDYVAKIRESRTTADEHMLKAFDALLTDEQKETIDAVEQALTQFDDKVVAAAEEAKEKLIELLGEEKVRQAERWSRPPFAGHFGGAAPGVAPLPPGGMNPTMP